MEDAAEAHGALYRMPGGSERVAGLMGDVSIFSFCANKLITTGGGGMVLTDSDQLADRARSLRNLAFGSESRFVHDSLGFNFRMTNMQAALGVAQIGRFAEIVARKRWAASRYLQLLDGIPGLQLPVERAGARSVYWMFGIVLDDGFDMDAAGLAEALRKRGVDTRPFFVGLHEQPVLREMGLVDEGHFQVTERLARRGLYLPSGLSLTDDQITRVADVVREVLIG